jgi:heme exporter protein A
MLEADDLKCERGGRTLFSSLSFALRGGELLRIAGANGTGKTSLLRTVCGLLAPAQGAVRWRGEDIFRLREEFWRELIYVGHANALKDDLTAAENLSVSCTLGGRGAGEAKVHGALRQLGLEGRENQPARVLSQGQRRRVALARLALSGDVLLWVLDEPFTALDTAAVDDVQEMIAQHVARGGVVIYTTHLEARIAAAVSRYINLDPVPGESPGREQALPGVR